MRSCVEVGSWYDENEVGLRLRVLVEPHRVLDADDCGVDDLAAEQPIQPIYTGCVPTTNRGHLDDLPFNQFDAVVLRKDPRGSHLVVFPNVEPAGRWQSRHAAPPAEIIRS